MVQQIIKGGGERNREGGKDDDLSAIWILCFINKSQQASVETGRLGLEFVTTNIVSVSFTYILKIVGFLIDPHEFDQVYEYFDIFR